MKFKDINLENDDEMIKFAEDNNWLKCKNGCCLFDPNVEQDRTCLGEMPHNDPWELEKKSQKIMKETN